MKESKNVKRERQKETSEWLLCLYMTDFFVCPCIDGHINIEGNIKIALTLSELTGSAGATMTKWRVEKFSSLQTGATNTQRHHQSLCRPSYLLYHSIMSRGRRSSRGDEEHVVNQQEEESEEEEEEEEEEVEMMFSQMAPEASQPIHPVKLSERNNLENLGTDNKEKIIVALSRLILFKALEGEPIDRLATFKEANADSTTSDRIVSAVFDEAARNLSNVFGFELRRVPKYLEESKTLPKKFKDRMYVINDVDGDEDDQETTDLAAHSKAIHSVHDDSSIEKGLLMICLALAFCKGVPRNDKSRWITDSDLYRLLHSIDENIPPEPPAAANRKVTATRHYRHDVGTPDVDSLLAKFVHQDYLLKEKVSEQQTGPGSHLVENTFQYAMGPRAAMEIGRKQIVYFCAEVLDEEPDETMIAEIEQVEDFMEDD